MDTMLQNNMRRQTILGVIAGIMLAGIAVGNAQAQDDTTDMSGTVPPLIITSDQVPQEIRDKVYSKPARVREITSDEVMGQSYYEATDTIVGDKIKTLESQLGLLQSAVANLIANVNSLQKQNEGKSAQYYADIATISTQLQSGTTPGNPRLVKRLRDAEASLEDLGTSVQTMNKLASDSAVRASEASYLLEAARAAYSLSGAVEEDHVRLAELEDAINNTSVIIERLLNNVSDDITRTSTYLSSERNNLRALATGVANGDLYGKSLGNRPFSNASVYQASATAADIAATPTPAVAASVPSASGLPGPRPLVKIRFDRPDVDYQQPVYMAVNEALQRYPNAQFDLVAVHPSQGNAAEIAIESTRARRNAEKVLRTLTEMGLDLERVNLSYTQSPDAKTNEVHLYVR